MIFVSVQASLITNVSDLHLGKHFYTLFRSVELSVFTVTDFTGTLSHASLYPSLSESEDITRKSLHTNLASSSYLTTPVPS